MFSPSRQVAVTAPLFLSVLFTICVSITGCDKSTNVSPKKAAKLTTVEFKNEKLTINSTALPFPLRLDELAAILGEPDRADEKVNTIYVWDDLGIIAYKAPDTDQLHSIDIAFVNQGFDFSPRTNFAGGVTIDGGAVDVNSSPADLEAAGLKNDDVLPFLYETRSADYSVIAEYHNGTRGISIDSLR